MRRALLTLILIASAASAQFPTSAVSGGGGGGGGGISGLTTNKIPKAGSSTTIVDGGFTDDGTTISTSENFKAAQVCAGSSCPALTPGTGGVIAICPEGTAPTVGPASAVDLIYCDSTLHKPLLSNNNGPYFALTQTIFAGTKALATSAIGSAACSSAQTVTATGTLTTDIIQASFNGDPTAVTGYVPLTAGMLTIIAYPTADTVNFKVCNNTSSSITPGSITLNVRVSR